MDYFLSSRVQYSNEVCKHINLEDSQIIRLVNKAQNGDKKALEMIVLSFQRMIIKISNKFIWNNKLDFMDLVQEGNMGLLKAIRTYKHSRNSKFSTYSYYIIYKSILKSIHTQSNLIKLPQYVIKNNNDLVYPRIIQSLNEYDKELNIEELEKFPQNVFEEPFEYALKFEEKILIENYLRSINPKIREIIFLYFGLCGNERHTYKEIGKLYNISKSAVCQIIIKQTKILRKKLLIIEV